MKDLPIDEGSEIAFCGRSNSGKSTLLNTITNNKKLAKTSKTPGRTQTLNVFCIDEFCQKRIVDLPGYGFAKVSKNLRKEWGYIINQYLSSRLSLKGLILIMDIRQALKESDLMLIKWSKKNYIPLKVVLNKGDKLSKSKVIKEIKSAEKKLEDLSFEGKPLPFSSKSLMGVDELRETLNNWFKI